MYPGNKRKKVWREEKERLLKMTLEERRKEYIRDYVPLKDIPTWMEEMKSKTQSDGACLPLWYFILLVFSGLDPKSNFRCTQWDSILTVQYQTIFKNPFTFQTCVAMMHGGIIQEKQT